MSYCNKALRLIYPCHSSVEYGMFPHNDLECKEPMRILLHRFHDSSYMLSVVVIFFNYRDREIFVSFVYLFRKMRSIDTDIH